MSTLDSWALRRLLTGGAINGELQGVSRTFRGLADHLVGLPVEARQVAFGGFLAGRDDRETIIKSLADVDPEDLPPETEPARSFATVADVRRVLSECRWVWNGWIPSSRIVGIGGFEGTGKTRLALDLCRRVYLHLPWPDGQPPTLPAGTRSLWVCADAHQDELADMMPAFGLPDEAVIFPAPPEDPYGGTDLDDPATMEALEAAIVATRPAFLFVDTLTAATSRDLCEQRTMKPLKAPLVHLAQTYQVCIMLQLHLSREGQALGRRIKGVTRTLIHLECPDTEHPERLKMWVEKSYAKRPTPLGVTMSDSGNAYDFDPPRAPEPSKGGRPPEKLDKAIRFLTERLTKGDRKGCELIGEWEDSGGAKGTIFNAKRAMEGDGRLVVDDSVKPQVWHLAKDETQVNNPVSDLF